MKTEQLLKEIINNAELHDLITHLEDFKKAVEWKLEHVKQTGMVSHDEYLSDISYWEKQLRVVNNLIEVCREEK